MGQINEGLTFCGLPRIDFVLPSERMMEKGRKGKSSFGFQPSCQQPSARSSRLSRVYFSLLRDGKYGVLKPLARLLSRPGHFSVAGSS